MTCSSDTPKKIHEGGRFGGFGTHKRKTKTHKKSELPENSVGSGGRTIVPVREIFSCLGSISSTANPGISSRRWKLEI